MSMQLRFGVSLEGPAADLSDVPDGEFVSSVQFRSRSPLSNGDGSDDGLRMIGLCWKQQWQQRLDQSGVRQCARFSFLDGLVNDAQNGSVFAVLEAARGSSQPANVNDPRKPDSKRRADRPGRFVPLLEQWLDGPASRAELAPPELLACCELLTEHVRDMSATLTGRVWRLAFSAALRLSDWIGPAESDADWEAVLDRADAGEESLLDNWLKGGLLPWACGLIFEDVKGASALLRAGKTGINDQLLLVTFDDGAATAAARHQLVPLLNGWNDATCLGQLSGRDVWKSSSVSRLSLLLQRLAAQLTTNGQLSGGSADADVRPQLRMLASVCSTHAGTAWHDRITAAQADGDDSAVTAGQRKRRRKQSEVSSSASSGDGAAGRKRVRKVKPSEIPSWQSDESEQACLRTTWAADASLITLHHDGDTIGLELVVQGESILRGPWGLNLSEDGDELEFEGGWECVCWYSEPEVDYCELQFEFEGGPSLSRFVLLSRVGQFAVVGDVVYGSPAKRVDFASHLPLAEHVRWTTQAGIRQSVLQTDRHQVQVYPLVLPCDAGQGTAGSCRIESAESSTGGASALLSVAQPSEIGGLFSPIVFDWSGRTDVEATEWRTLTVTEGGHVDPTGAAAYRLNNGAEHLVLYRALRRSEQYRTFLGYQTTHETVIANFTRKGPLSELLLVE